MARLFVNQEIRFGDHTLIVKSVKEGKVYARCVDTCCSSEVRVAIAARESEFMSIIDAYNYRHAQSSMAATIRDIASITGVSQQQDDEVAPDQSWEKQALIMEH